MAETRTSTTRACVIESLEADIVSPAAARKLVDRLTFMKVEQTKRKKANEKQLNQIERYLSIADDVTHALDSLSRELFQEVLEMLESKLTIAIQEVLEQPIKFKAIADFKRGSAIVDFAVERNGYEENIKLGQGGSVQNVLSVGLRMFALAMLDTENVHRKFLVLDEQDCWLRPELVPRLVNIVHRAATELGFQVIMISHHDRGWFEKFADRIYNFTPTAEGVSVKQLSPAPAIADSQEL